MRMLKSSMAKRAAISRGLGSFVVSGVLEIGKLSPVALLWISEFELFCSKINMSGYLDARKLATRFMVSTHASSLPGRHCKTFGREFSRSSFRMACSFMYSESMVSQL